MTRYTTVYRFHNPYRNKENGQFDFKPGGTGKPLIAEARRAMAAGKSTPKNKSVAGSPDKASRARWGNGKARPGAISGNYYNNGSYSDYYQDDYSGEPTPSIYQGDLTSLEEREQARDVSYSDPGYGFPNHETLRDLGRYNAWDSYYADAYMNPYVHEAIRQERPTAKDKTARKIMVLLGAMGVAALGAGVIHAHFKNKEVNALRDAMAQSGISIPTTKQNLIAKALSFFTGSTKQQPVSGSGVVAVAADEDATTDGGAATKQDDEYKPADKVKVPANMNTDLRKQIAKSLRKIPDLQGEDAGEYVKYFGEPFPTKVREAVLNKVIGVIAESANKHGQEVRVLYSLEAVASVVLGEGASATSNSYQVAIAAHQWLHDMGIIVGDTQPFFGRGSITGGDHTAYPKDYRSFTAPKPLPSVIAQKQAAEQGTKEEREAAAAAKKVVDAFVAANAGHKALSFSNSAAHTYNTGTGREVGTAIPGVESKVSGPMVCSTVSDNDPENAVQYIGRKVTVLSLNGDRKRVNLTQVPEGAVPIVHTLALRVGGNITASRYAVFEKGKLKDAGTRITVIPDASALVTSNLHDAIKKAVESTTADTGLLFEVPEFNIIEEEHTSTRVANPDYGKVGVFRFENGDPTQNPRYVFELSTTSPAINNHLSPITQALADPAANAAKKEHTDKKLRKTFISDGVIASRFNYAERSTWHSLDSALCSNIRLPGVIPKKMEAGDTGKDLAKKKFLQVQVPLLPSKPDEVLSKLKLILDNRSDQMVPTIAYDVGADSGSTEIKKHTRIIDGANTTCATLTVFRPTGTKDISVPIKLTKIVEHLERTGIRVVPGTMRSGDSMASYDDQFKHARADKIVVSLEAFSDEAKAFLKDHIITSAKHVGGAAEFAPSTIGSDGAVYKDTVEIQIPRRLGTLTDKEVAFHKRLGEYQEQVLAAQEQYMSEVEAWKAAGKPDDKKPILKNILLPEDLNDNMPAFGVFHGLRTDQHWVAFSNAVLHGDTFNPSAVVRENIASKGKPGVGPMYGPAGVNEETVAKVLEHLNANKSPNARVSSAKQLTARAALIGAGRARSLSREGVAAAGLQNIFRGDVQSRSTTHKHVDTFMTTKMSDVVGNTDTVEDAFVNALAIRDKDGNIPDRYKPKVTYAVHDGENATAIQIGDYTIVHDVGRKVMYASVGEHVISKIYAIDEKGITSVDNNRKKAGELIKACVKHANYSARHSLHKGNPEGFVSGQGKLYKVTDGEFQQVMHIASPQLADKLDPKDGLIPIRAYLNIRGERVASAAPKEKRDPVLEQSVALLDLRVFSSHLTKKYAYKPKGDNAGYTIEFVVHKDDSENALELPTTSRIQVPMAAGGKSKTNLQVAAGLRVYKDGKVVKTKAGFNAFIKAMNAEAKRRDEKQKEEQRRQAQSGDAVSPTPKRRGRPKKLSEPAFSGSALLFSEALRGLGLRRLR